MIPLHIRTVDGSPPTREQIDAVMKLASDNDVDTFLREANERRERGITVLKRLATAVGKSERVQETHRDDAFELVKGYKAFVVSVEMLEAIADHIEQLELIKCPTMDRDGRLCEG